MFLLCAIGVGCGGSSKPKSSMKGDAEVANADRDAATTSEKHPDAATDRMDAGNASTNQPPTKPTQKPDAAMPTSDAASAKPDAAMGGDMMMSDAASPKDAGGELPDTGVHGGELNDAAAPTDAGDSAAGPSTIFASQSTGDDAKDGTDQAHPVKTLTRAIALAGACLPSPCEVHVAAGTYVEPHTLTLIGGVNVLGGYQVADWKRTLGASETTIQAPDTVTIKADTLSLPTTLDKLTIKGTNATATGGDSVAVQVSNNNNLAITNSIINAGNGARGADGASGIAMTCSVPGGSGGVASDCASGSGPDGTASLAGPGGKGATGGSSNCPDACPLTGADGVSNGNQASNGVDGMPGSPGAAVTTSQRRALPTGCRTATAASSA